MKTIENDELISRFLGKKFKDGMVVIGNWNICTQNPSGEVWQDTAYHSDWNWLMELVEKITELPYCKTSFREVVKVTGLPISVKKEEIYNACVEFIKWYNLQR